MNLVNILELLTEELKHGEKFLKTIDAEFAADIAAEEALITAHQTNITMIQKRREDMVRATELRNSKIREVLGVQATPVTLAVVPLEENE